MTRAIVYLTLLACFKIIGCERGGSRVDGGGEAMELRTKRLGLRGFTTGDWQDLHELAVDWRKAPGPEFDKWPTSEKAARGLAEHFSTSPRYFAMCLKENQKVVGLLALNGYDKEGQFDLGHVIHSDHHNNDIGREASQPRVDHIFRTASPVSIVTHNDPTHREQLAPLVALGFSRASEGEQGTLMLAKDQWER